MPRANEGCKKEKKAATKVPKNGQRTVRRRDFGPGDPHGRLVQVIKGVFHGQGQDLGRDAEAREARLDRDQAVRLLDGLDDGLDVHGLDGPQVDHLGLDAVLGLELLGRHERLPDRSGQGHDGDVLAYSFDLGLAKLNHGRSVSGMSIRA